MLDEIESDTKVDKKKLKAMVRRGIPDSIRGEAWIILSSSNKLFPTEDYEGRRQKWMKRELLAKKLPKDDLRNIITDVPRTMGKNVTGQRTLFAVLKCLAINYPDIGYLQSMNYLVLTLMKYTTPENSFMIVISLFENYKIKGYYQSDMAGFKKDCYILLSL